MYLSDGLFGNEDGVKTWQSLDLCQKSHISTEGVVANFVYQETGDGQLEFLWISEYAVRLEHTLKAELLQPKSIVEPKSQGNYHNRDMHWSRSWTGLFVQRP